MSSGAQAQIAASQAATEAQAAAAANALAFSREQFDYMKGLRAPYNAAGTSATNMLMNLLGLNTIIKPPGGVIPTGGGGGTGGGGTGTGGGGTGTGGTGTGTSGPIGGSTVGGTGGTGGGGTIPGGGNVPSLGGTSSSDVKFPGYYQEPYSPAFQQGGYGPGYEAPFPGYDWTGSSDVGSDPNPNFDPTDTSGLPSLVPNTPVLNPNYPMSSTSGLATVTNASGESRQVPTSLLSFYQAQGWNV